MHIVNSFNRSCRWSDENTKVLCKLWDAGLAASLIAQRIGEGFTRSAVLGKAHRLQLAPRRVNERAPIMPRKEQRRRYEGLRSIAA